MRKSFENLPTVKFQERMKPAALRIYRRLFPGCEVEDLRKEGVKVHVLDKEFGIDALIRFQAGQWVSIQEKLAFRRFLRGPQDGGDGFPAILRPGAVRVEFQREPTSRGVSI